MSDLSTDIENELRAVARRLLAEHSPVRRAISPAVEDGLWGAISAAGWPALLTPEEYGGAGYHFGGFGVLFTEMGRQVAESTLISSGALAATALLAGGARPDLLGAIATGETVATVAVTHPGHESGTVTASSTPSGTAVLDGSIGPVLDAQRCDVLLVEATRPGGARSIHVVPRAVAGLTIVAHRSIDLTRDYSMLLLDRVEVDGDSIASGEDAERVLGVLLDTAAVCIAADSAGGAERVLEMTVDYVKDRHQFGRPIGSFQAVKHRCADMFVRVLGAKAAAAAAVEQIVADGAGSPTASIAASVAKSYCADAFAEVAHGAVLMHGAIGVTWEHDLHLYLKRAKANQALFGSSTWHRLRVADRMSAAVGSERD